jgi:hypothetical protein
MRTTRARPRTSASKYSRLVVVMTACVLSKKYPKENPAAAVELAHHVVKEQDGILPGLRPHVVPGGELEGERREPLLTLRTERRHIDSAEQHLEVVPVRTDRRRAPFDVRAVRPSERLRVAFEGAL